jgi:L-ascorbate metabolism protein UlaG (beta-lactamase superfamily)
MPEYAVWIPNGSRAGVSFASADVKIRKLTGFVSEMAGALRRGSSLAWAARSAARLHPAAAEAFDLDQPDAAIEAGFALSDKLTFPREALPEHIGFARRDKRFALKLDAVLARDVHSLLALCGSGRYTANEIRSELDEPASLVFDSLLERRIVIADAPPIVASMPTKAHAGITRLQHAALLYRGREAGVLVDPHFHSSYEPDDLGANFLRSEFEGLVDAILISHGHHDHWHLPTLMTFPADTLIIVPKVPRATMLCPDFAATLRALGFTRVVTLGWHDPPVRVGDLEVHALPFYGEQPLLNESPRHPQLRNYGNTYLVRHDSYTSWFLVDSGNDCTGSMAQVAHEVKARFGAIDVLLSNLREFALYQPLAITGGHYWLALTPDQIRRFASISDDVITLGPHGVAEICAIVQARCFLPYAHWWDEIGAHPPHEESCIEQLHSTLRERRTATTIVPWRIGDSYLPPSA